MNVDEIMTQDPMTVGTNARVRDVVQILQTLEIRHVPIVGDANTLVGMVSDRDLRNARIPYTIPEDRRTEGNRELDQPITSIMSSDVLSVGPETDIVDVIDLMLENKVGAVPVIEDATGDLLGIVSYVDVLRELRNALG
jgi:acetoin utilization protein AcuB